MKNRLLTGILGLLLPISSIAQEVQMTEKPLVLPTYETGAPDANPIFYTGRVYQGAQGHIYPYPLIDVLTDTKIDKSYHAVYLENQYIKVCVLPEIGGRILSATDKTNNYEIFYRQSGIKPALIGMLGAWLSGGVEWNIPHHHRPSSYMPIDWKLENNEDGSKTIWVGEMELRHRMRWSVGVTVYPDRSWVEAKVRIVNRSPFTQSMLYWANVSVHCNEDYEVVFPPETEFGVDHYKVYFTRWPMGEAVLKSGKEANLAWWKNYTGGSRSIFAWNFEDDFLAGYDHGKEAGTVHVANHHIVTGKKFFLWGNNPHAEMWNKILSDKDGHYLELMVGAFSDNQPDYSWIAPGETREFIQRWYGIRDIGAVKNANDNAAVNLELTSQGKIFIGFNTTTEYPDAKIVLKQGDAIAFEKTADISPETPFTTTISAPKNLKYTDLHIALYNKEGELLIAYQPKELEKKELPKVIEGTKPVTEYETVEELYYAGLRIEQFHNARLNALDFYHEALQRDSLDSRTNTAMGIHYAKNGEWQKAEQYLKRALIRPSKDYTVVKNTEPHYYLGLIYQQQGRLKEATDQYWKATWLPTFQHPAYLGLAQISTFKGNLDEALSLAEQALNTGGKDTKALTLKAYLLRKTGKTEQAKTCIKKVLDIDPLDYWSLAEESFLKGGNFPVQEEKQRGKGIIRLQELLEVALDYARIGAFKEAAMLLDNALTIGEPYTSSPLIGYYNGYYRYLTGDKESALSEWKRASSLPTERCFPFRTEETDILNTVCTACPDDGAACYYSGNLYYFLQQKEKGMAYWERAVAQNDKLYQAYRNLGFGYQQQDNLEKAIANYEKAIALNNQDPRLFQELDVLYQKAHKPTKERLEILEKNISTVNRHDDAVIQLLTLYNETGLYDKAIDIMDNRHFHVWEGGGKIREIYFDSHLLKAMDLLRGKEYEKAIKEFELSDLYPNNLEVGRPSNGGHSAKGFYYKGLAYKYMGNRKKATEAFKTAAYNQGNSYSSAAKENTLFNALALKEIGKHEEAEKQLKKLSEEIASQLNSEVSVDAYSKFGEDGSKLERTAYLYYIQGMIHCTRNDIKNGKEFLQKSLDINPNQIWAKKFLTWY